MHLRHLVPSKLSMALTFQEIGVQYKRGSRLLPEFLKSQLYKVISNSELIFENFESSCAR